jgi:hypothetical protein
MIKFILVVVFFIVLFAIQNWSDEQMYGTPEQKEAYAKRKQSKP